MPLTIVLDDAAGVLNGNGSALYAFRVVTAINAAALPSVWSRKAPPLPKKYQLVWKNDLTAYAATTPVTAGNAIVIGVAKAIKPGQTLAIDVHGDAEIVTGDAATIGFDNQMSTAVTCGLIQQVSGMQVPFCAFPITPNAAQGVMPSGAMLLFFSTANLSPGTIAGNDTDADAIRTEGVLVTDTSVPRTLTFSAATGTWTWDGGTWAATVQPDAPIVPLLISSS